jgi:hypothetical protein
VTNTLTELSSTTTAWLQEGLWLKDVIMRLVDPGLVVSYIEARDACLRLPWRRPGSTGSMMPEEWRVRRRHGESHKACVTPLVDALNRGRIIAARPDYCSSKFFRLLPPATGWDFRVFDSEKSLIFDPKRSYGSLFVLFMCEGQRSAVALEPATIIAPIDPTDQRRPSSRSSSKKWLTSAVQRIPPDDRRRGWKRRYAKKLATIMVEEATINKALKPLLSTSIGARLGEHKLWPR